jgi:hypothetical protein
MERKKELMVVRTMDLIPTYLVKAFLPQPVVIVVGLVGTGSS